MEDERGYWLTRRHGRRDAPTPPIQDAALEQQRLNEDGRRVDQQVEQRAAGAVVQPAGPQTDGRRPAGVVHETRANQKTQEVTRDLQS